jgi:hypothetical protein
VREDSLNPDAGPEMRPSAGAKNPQSREKQLQIITIRWHTIELETKQGLKGWRLEDASSRRI